MSLISPARERWVKYKNFRVPSGTAQCSHGLFSTNTITFVLFYEFPCAPSAEHPPQFAQIPSVV
jgi:hypothetical protein